MGKKRRGIITKRKTISFDWCGQINKKPKPVFYQMMELGSIWISSKTQLILHNKRTEPIPPVRYRYPHPIPNNKQWILAVFFIFIPLNRFLF